jgi:hypothetical protein
MPPQHTVLFLGTATALLLVSTAVKPVVVSGVIRLEVSMNFQWELIGNFGSLRERDRFLAWMRSQIRDGLAEEVEAPAGSDADDRWFVHIPTGSLWRLLSDENPHGPGFWPADANNKAA